MAQKDIVDLIEVLSSGDHQILKYTEVWSQQQSDDSKILFEFPVTLIHINIDTGIECSEQNKALGQNSSMRKCSMWKAGHQCQCQQTGLAKAALFHAFSVAPELALSPAHSTYPHIDGKERHLGSVLCNLLRC